MLDARVPLLAELGAEARAIWSRIGLANVGGVVAGGLRGGGRRRTASFTCVVPGAASWTVCRLFGAAAGNDCEEGDGEERKVTREVSCCHCRNNGNASHS